MIRVASVPASHVYVRHLAQPMGKDGVVRLDDPVPPADGRKVPGGWWPPVMLDPGWIREHHHLFDLFHVHFGFDAIAPQVMEDIVHELRSHDIPLVYTVHDLRNPPPSRSRVAPGDTRRVGTGGGLSDHLDTGGRLHRSRTIGGGNALCCLILM